MPVWAFTIIITSVPVTSFYMYVVGTEIYSRSGDFCPIQRQKCPYKV